MAIEQLPGSLDDEEGRPTDTGHRKQALADQKPMSVHTPLLSGGTPHATLRTVYDAIADRFQRDGVREADMTTFRWRPEATGMPMYPV
jgi:hypothetical protein